MGKALCTYSHMDNTPDTALAIALEDVAHLVSLGEVAGEDVDDGAFPVLLGRVRREDVARELGHTLERGGVGVVVIVDGDDLVPAGLEQLEDDVGPCRDRPGCQWGASLSDRVDVPM